MSLSYNNLPVYIGGTSSNYYVPATQVNVNYTTSPNPKRKLGSTIATGDQFGYEGALQAEISVDSLIHEDMQSGFAFLETVNQADYTSVDIGDNTFNKCYALDVNVQIEPFQPVTLQTKFVSLDPPTGVQITGGSETSHSLTGDDVAYGHTCSVSDSAGVLNDVQSQISFSRRYARTPTFELGSINASQMFLDGIEEEATIASTGLENLIDFSGELLNNTVTVAINNVGAGISIPFNDLISFTKGATIVNESYGVAGGQTVQTSATLKQIKL